MADTSQQKFSIALCTYNGERFLLEQLESIAAQTVLPFELVICDDASSDSTKEILEQFAATADFPVKLHFNTENLGYVKNFEKAISLCSGEIVALSDHDDRWRFDKLEMLSQAFANPEVAMAFSNAALMDEKGSLIGQFLWDRVHFDSELQQLFTRGEGYKITVKRHVVYGCTLAFRNKWWPLIEPFENDTLMHDGSIALMTSLFGTVEIIDQPLICYRLHAQQTTAKDRQISKAEKLSNGRQKTNLLSFQKKLHHLELTAARIQKYDKYIPSEKKHNLSEDIQEQQQHLKLRIAIFQGKRVSVKQILNELKSGRYHRYSRGYKNAIGDFLRNIFLKIFVP